MFCSRRHTSLFQDLEKAEEGADRWAVENGWTSVTPLRLDLTDESALSAALKEHHGGEFRAMLVAVGRGSVRTGRRTSTVRCG
jgi:hypothetical protein